MCKFAILIIFPVTMLSSCVVKFVLPVSCAICVPVDWRDLQLQINIHLRMQFSQLFGIEEILLSAEIRVVIMA